jgi:hypothetical protein
MGRDQGVLSLRNVFWGKADNLTPEVLVQARLNLTYLKPPRADNNAMIRIKPVSRS